MLSARLLLVGSVFLRANSNKSLINVERYNRVEESERKCAWGTFAFYCISVRRKNGRARCS